MVEKLTELGVHRLQFVDCQRSVATPDETRIDKLKASVIAACKQSRRPIQMDLLPIKPWRSVIDEGTNSYKHLFLAHPDRNAANLLEQTITGDTMILVGPEGGFTDDEVQYAIDAGIRTISWPGTILRIESAAIVFGTLALASSRRQV
jgi:16S rRNA (uracil1498-N3)-methyltransferase